MNPIRIRSIFLVIGLVALAAISACSSDPETVVVTEIQTVIVEKEVKGDTVVETVVVEKEVKGDTIVQTVVVEVTPTPLAALATASPTKIKIPEPKSSTGTLVVIPRVVGPGPGLNRSQAPEAMMYWGVTEQLFRPDGDELVGPWLATGWSIAPDYSSATVTIRSGVQFHDGWGELTAEDIAWSVNDANGTTTPLSIHGQAGDFASFLEEASAIDDQTLFLPFSRYDSRWDDRLFNLAGDSFAVFSKKAYDEKGVDWMRENPIGTGPFEVVEWLDAERVTLSAVDSHWDVVPLVDTLRFINVPESATKRAMMETGEADLAIAMQLRDVADLVAGGFKSVTTGTQWNNGLKFSGNFWEATNAKTGDPLEHPTMLRENPWIGNPFSPDDGNNPPGMDDMEQARLVRWALSMAIDRELVAETLFAGLVRPYYIGMFSPDDPNWESKWEVPYDPAKAREYLDQAGYPAGDDGVRFTAQVYGFSGNATYQDSADAVAGFWSEIGVQTEVLKVSYGLVRPSFVARSSSIPTVMTCVSDLWLPYDEPRAEEETSLTRGGFGCQMELPKVLETIQALETEFDTAKRIGINKELADYMHKWMVGTGVTTGPILNVYNPNAIKEWPLRPSPQSPENSYELIVPAR